MAVHNLRLRRLDANNASDRAAVLKYPYRLYRGDRYWVAPPLREQKRWLDPRRHPERDGLAIAFFLAEGYILRQSYASEWAVPVLGGELTLGVIGVMFDPEQDGDNTAAFFCFEFYNDEEVAERLLDAAWEWALEQGAERLQGPAAPFGWGHDGVLVDGFDVVPAFLASYHLPYYAESIESAGWQVAAESTIYRLKLSKTAPISLPPDLRWGHFDSHDQRFQELPLSQVLLHSGCAVPRQTMAAAVIQRLAPFLLPDLTLSLETKSDGRWRQLGFVIATPDLHQVWRHGWGVMGRLRRLVAPGRVHRVRVLSLVVEPDAASEDSERLIVHEICRRAADLGFTELEVGPVTLERPALSALLASGGGAQTKHYRLYERSLGAW